MIGQIAAGAARLGFEMRTDGVVEFTKFIR
jgi:hypothetical protein